MIMNSICVRIRRSAGYLFIVLLPFVISACFPMVTGPRIEHFDDSAPQTGAAAPDFTLYDLRGEEQPLAQWLGDKPLVLQIGSHTCPVYRNRRHGMQRLYDKYGDQVNFLMVYTLEAHPSGSKSPYADAEWLTVWNQVPGVLIPQHTSLQERMMVASMSKTEVNLDYPYLVDDLGNTTWKAYGSVSSPAFVIDRNGIIALRQIWLDPGEIDKTLVQLLAQ